MSGEIPFYVAGNLTRDAELRFPREGKPVAGLALAVTPRRYDVGSRQWVDGTPTYVDLSVWGDQAEHVADSIRKGERVIVLGRWLSRTYVADGQERRKLDVTVDEIGPSLRWATALPTKATAKTGQPAADHHRSDGREVPGPPTRHPWACLDLRLIRHGSAAGISQEPLSDTTLSTKSTKSGSWAFGRILGVLNIGTRYRHSLLRNSYNRKVIAR